MGTVTHFRKPRFAIHYFEYTSIRGIRYLTDQNSLINPGPLMHLNMFYSNSFWKNCKILASETIKVYEMKWPSATGAEVNGTYYVNQIFLFQFSMKIIDKFQRRRLTDLRNRDFLNFVNLFPRILIVSDSTIW